MSLQPLKICPKCQAASTLSAQVCVNCNHRFRTQFAVVPEQKYQLESQQKYLPEPEHFSSTQAGPNTVPQAPRLVSQAPLFALPLSEIQSSVPLPEAPQVNRKRLILAAFLAAGGSALLLLLFVLFTLNTSQAMDRPGHPISAEVAESLTPYCSPHQVWETLGAPQQELHDTWKYPTSEGDVVSVTFSKVGGVKSVDNIIVTDDSGGVLWQKAR